MRVKYQSVTQPEDEVSGVINFFDTSAKIDANGTEINEGTHYESAKVTGDRQFVTEVWKKEREETERNHGVTIKERISWSVEERI